MRSLLTAFALILTAFGGVFATNFNQIPGNTNVATLWEPPLGNPSVNGYVLSSTTAGVRSWIVPAAGGGSVSITATAPIVVTPSPLTGTGVISVTGSALTRTDDTNVTLTLGGTPATALLQPTSLTLGWTGTLAVARGGTGAATAAANTVFGNNTGSTAAPGFQTLVDAQVPDILTVTRASNLTSNGFVKTSGGNGTLSVDTTAAYEVPLTFSTGLTRSTNTVTVNTTQNITTLSNLTSNGFVRTSGGGGALGIDTAAYEVALGNPSTNGYVLSSTTGGTRSWIAPAVLPINSSVSIQSLSTSDVYLTGSNTVVAAGGFKAKGQYRCVFDIVKSAGTGAIVITLRVGTAGAIGDAAILTFTFGAGTSVADTGTFEVIATWRTVGSGSSAVMTADCRAQHNLATTGLFNNAAAWVVVGGVSSGFDSSTATNIGLSFNGATAFSGQTNLVQATLMQP